MDTSCHRCRADGEEVEQVQERVSSNRELMQVALQVDQSFVTHLQHGENILSLLFRQQQRTTLYRNLLRRQVLDSLELEEVALLTRTLTNTRTLLLPLLIPLILQQLPTLTVTLDPVRCLAILVECLNPLSLKSQTPTPTRPLNLLHSLDTLLDHHFSFLLRLLFSQTPSLDIQLVDSKMNDLKLDRNRKEASLGGSRNGDQQ